MTLKNYQYSLVMIFKFEEYVNCVITRMRAVEKPTSFYLLYMFCFTRLEIIHSTTQRVIYCEELENVHKYWSFKVMEEFLNFRGGTLFCTACFYCEATFALFCRQNGCYSVTVIFIVVVVITIITINIIANRYY